MVMKSIMCAISPLLQICLLVGFVVVLYAIIGLQFLNGSFHYICVDKNSSTSIFFVQLLTIVYHIEYHSIQYHNIAYYTIPCHTIPYHNIPYHTIPYHTIPYRTVPYRTVPYRTVPYRTVPYRTVPYRTVPYHTLAHTLPYLSTYLCLYKYEGDNRVI